MNPETEALITSTAKSMEMIFACDSSLENLRDGDELSDMGRAGMLAVAAAHKHILLKPEGIALIKNHAQELEELADTSENTDEEELGEEE